MSGRLLRLVCTAALATQVALVPGAAVAVPEPDGSAEPSVAELLTDLQKLYRDAERATEAYNATEEQLRRKRAEVARLDGQLARARLALDDSRGEAGRLARRQYQSSSDLSPYLRLLLARDPQHVLDQGHVIGQVARERAGTTARLAGDERRRDELARKARAALDARITLTERRKKERDDVRRRLDDVEEMVASLSAEQLHEVADLERTGVAERQRELEDSGALGEDDGKPTAEGERAVRNAVRQLGKPYQWGAEGPRSYDCSGLTSWAWDRAGTSIPRTSQEQWAKLPRVPLDALRPGDLVVYFPEATHVALYLGDGLVVQAPRPGARVKVSPLAANPVLGAVRPDPDARPVRHHTPPKLPAAAPTGGDEGYASAAVPE
ncbi:NlpC/P60 family protein [Streptomyces longwoodensis]|uniref:C40 family peptidase n=1 Tax=Streptomyces longwoodensis TaxID=68231 RepID=UPI002DDAD450|nr:NlpC/P60 family protein [Streptomyces longwoodensis]WRY90629.1 NlpC/P60 family protein [Streptomyces longwoodensis]